MRALVARADRVRNSSKVAVAVDAAATVFARLVAGVAAVIFWSALPSFCDGESADGATVTPRILRKLVLVN